KSSPIPTKISLAKFKIILTDLRNTLENWHDTIRKQYTEMKQFLLLSKKQFITFISKFTDTAIDNSTVLKELVPYLRIILCGQVNYQQLDEETIKKLFIESIKSGTDQLQRATHFIKQVFALLNVKQEQFKPKQKTEESETFVVNASRLNDLQLLCFIL